MNNERRKKLNEITTKIKEIAEQLEELRGKVEEVTEEEQEAYDNMPSGLQSGDKGDEAQEHLDKLNTIYNEMDTGITCLSDAVDAIEEIAPSPKKAAKKENVA